MRELEHQEQKAFIQWCNIKGYPYNLIFAIPNGGKRNIVVARKLKAEGVKSGIPDLFLPVVSAQRSGLFIEMKSKNGKATAGQKQRMADLSREGYRCMICYGIDDAVKCVLDYVESKL